MLYLFIFGNNIEDAVGHVKFVGFYLFCGLCASALHILLTTNPKIPTLGASGAIAGVLGAYLVLYPRAKVDTLVIFVVFISWVTLPASVLLGFWFVLQLFSGSLSIAAGTATGVAYFAHVGGFLAGAALALPLRGRVNRNPPRRPRVVEYYGRDPYWL
jgi:membrane associated rhomboid family serine protease